MKKYDKIVMWWKDGNVEVEHTIYNKTIEEALESAKFFGYKKPVWWKPWQFITGGLGMITVSKYGSCEGRNK